MTEFNIQLVELIKSFNFDFYPTQNKLSIPLINRLHKKMIIGIEFDAIKVSNTGLIINGHHRYIASLLAKKNINIFPATENINQQKYDWNELILSRNDFDSKSQIKYHNYNDAQRNKIKLEELEILLSH